MTKILNKWTKRKQYKMNQQLSVQCAGGSELFVKLEDNRPIWRFLLDLAEDLPLADTEGPLT